MSGWISVSERKPDDFDDVLVFVPTSKLVTIAWQESDCPQWFEAFTDKPLNPVTHWQPLPAPPTE